jgi:hypothetical protein
LIVFLTSFGAMAVTYSAAVSVHQAFIFFFPVVINYALRLSISIVRDQDQFYLTWFSIRFRGPIESRRLRVCSFKSLIFDHFFAQKVGFFFIARRCIEIDSYGDYFIYLAPLNLAKLEKTILQGVRR